jgi:hypothetical protein
VKTESSCANERVPFVFKCFVKRLQRSVLRSTETKRHPASIIGSTSRAASLVLQVGLKDHFWDPQNFQCFLQNLATRALKYPLLPKYAMNAVCCLSQNVDFNCAAATMSRGMRVPSASRCKAGYEQKLLEKLRALT